MIKTLETVHHGVRFRSRLEARWAVFFDVLGVAWEYEPEKFELSDGRWYIPDFRVRVAGHYVEQTSEGLDLFVDGVAPPLTVLAEVKPTGGDFSKAYQLKFQHPILLLEGPPPGPSATADAHREFFGFVDYGLYPDWAAYDAALVEAASRRACSARFGAHP